MHLPRIALTALAPCALVGSAAAQLPVPTSLTTEWRFSGATNEFVDKVYGPGTLEFADGANGQTSMVDRFTTTTADNIPDINGVDTPCLYFDYHDPNTLGYLLRPLTGAANNNLFEFTLVYDLYLDPNNADTFGGLVNGNCCNTNDAELFIQPATESFWYPGLGGGQGQGSYQRGQWFRLVYAVSWSNATMECFVNGNLAFSGAPADWLWDGQTDPSWILSDNNGEVTQGWLAAFAVTDVVFSQVEATALGSPKPDGIFNDGLGLSFCTAAPNSTGATGAMDAEGSALVADNDLRLIATQLPNNAFGFFITSQTQGFVAMPGNSMGNLCLGGSIGRFQGQIVSTGNTGRFDIVADLTAFPSPTGGTIAVQGGETWNFQAWHRDVNGSSATSNFTDGLEIQFQ